MKRLRLAFPLAAIAFGIFLIARHGPGRPGATPGTGTIHVQVRSQGAGLGGARLMVIPEGGGERKFFETESNGAQNLLQVPAGDYAVEASAPRHVAQRVHINLSSGQTSEVLLDLERGSRIEGHVTDPKGRPLAGAKINVLNPSRQIFMRVALSADSDAQGHYVIDGVPLGDLNLHGYHPRFKPFVKKGILFDNVDRTVTADIAFEEGSRISGRVVNDSGAPVVGAQINASNEYSFVEVTDAQGRFALYGLGPSLMQLKVQAPGYATHYRSRIPPNSEEVEVRLARPGTISGTLEADPLPDHFQVIVYRSEADGAEQRLDIRPFSKTRGAFALADLEPGSYRLEIQADGWEAPPQDRVQVREGPAAAPLKIRITPKK